MNLMLYSQMITVGITVAQATLLSDGNLRVNPRKEKLLLDLFYVLLR